MQRHIRAALQGGDGLRGRLLLGIDLETIFPSSDENELLSTGAADGKADGAAVSPTFPGSRSSGESRLDENAGMEDKGDILVLV